LKHWKALGDYNERHGAAFFSLTPRGVRFNEHVGVIQVGQLTIEILPKVGKIAPIGEENRWQRVLIDMLRTCHWMKVHAHQNASLRIRYGSILEAYLEMFLDECDSILHQGLIRKYRKKEGQVYALKGKLVFSKQVQLNAAHQERFYTRHQVYDRDHIFNQILGKALKLIPDITQSPRIIDRVYNLLFSFPEMSDVRITPSTFDRLVYNRKTMCYRDAIAIAAMLLLNYRPDIRGGGQQVLAILFDMNDLWEEYVYRCLQRTDHPHLHVSRQQSRPFWRMQSSERPRKLRPDIVIESIVNPEKKMIIDTKWKLPADSKPSDEDVRQMFAYNEYWSSHQALLLYPGNASSEALGAEKGEFLSRGQESVSHHFGVMKLSVLNESGSLNKDLGKRLSLWIRSEMKE
jgi:5-methylcytosine-specific restriction enzyme subunit McrC